MENMKTSSLSVIIVDDEIEACNNLKNIINERADLSVDIKGIANNTVDAEKLIKRYNPDAVFLDIEMPEEDAFSFLQRMLPVSFEIIFVTAYDGYALKAFRLNAVDYILKPINVSELVEAINRLTTHSAYKSLLSEKNNSYNSLSRQINTGEKPSKIFLKAADFLEIVEFKDLLFIEAKGSYSRVHFLKGDKQTSVIMSHSIAEYENMLPKDIFCRVHKSYLLNCSFLRSVIKKEQLFAIIGQNIMIPISRRRYPVLINFLRINSFQYG